MFIQCGSTKDEKQTTQGVPSLWVVNFATSQGFQDYRTLRKEWGETETPPDTSVRDIFDIFCSNIDRDIPHKDGFGGTGGKRELGEKKAKQEVKFIPIL